MLQTQYSKKLNEEFLDIFDSVKLTQIVEFTTRKKATLDLLLTNRPGLINLHQASETMIQLL